MSQIQADNAVREELASRGITEKTGVFGNHQVQLGNGASIRLDTIKSARIPFQGFTTATKIARGQEGLQNKAAEVLKTLYTRTDTLDAGKLLGELKAMQNYQVRLGKLGQLTKAQKNDGMWTFTAAVESLSNRELSAVYQSFTSAEMDVLQTALQCEPKGSDARKAAAQLFDLQALVLKEISNRSINEQMAHEAANNQEQNVPDDDAAPLPSAPKTLTEQFGASGAVTQSDEAHDITAANLLSLTEIGASSATKREKTAQSEQAKLHARRLDDVTVKEMGDVLRKAELTINIQTEHLVSGPNSIFQHPNDPLVNIFHLHDQGTDPKGPGYLDERRSTEELLFPELKGRKVQADERPVYGALNVMGQKGGGGVSYHANYGRSAIVLKPEVAKRATYIADDTFFSPIINLSQERRANFYRLLDGVNNHEIRPHFGEDIPQSLITALKDPNSTEHKDFEAFLDSLDAVPGQVTVIRFRYAELPTSVRAHFPKHNDDLKESIASNFKAFLTECFGDEQATRSVIATHDNLESLITQMNSVDGNSLSRAVQMNRNGEKPKVCLHGAQYIEAQIQGPLIPSRDIAEIRIFLPEVPEDQRPEVVAQARQYEQDTGIKVTIVESYDVQEQDVDTNSQTMKEQLAFNIQHHDLEAIEHIQEEYLANLPDKIADFVKFAGVYNDLPKGALRLEGGALQRFKAKFLAAVEERKNTPSNDLAEEVVDVAFEQALRPIIMQKAELLRTLEQAELNAAQKTAVTNWIVSAQSLRSPQEVQVVLKQAKAQAAVFREIADAEPAPTAEQIITRMHTFTQDMDQDLAELVKSFNVADFGVDDKRTEQNRISFIALILLQNGEPPVAEDTLQKLYSRLNTPAISTIQGQIDAVINELAEPDNLEIGRIATLSNQLSHNAANIGNLIGQNYSAPPAFEGELSLLPEPFRVVMRQIAPKTAAKLDTSHPGYPPFPAPAQAQSMPQNEADRRHFLVHVMDGYLNHEKTFEKGSSVHGRGHIARAYIFANVMCNILEEQGLKIDKNAVLCGIAGHDLGREGGGTDRWEDRSANMTTQAMQSAFGPNSMGDAYEQQVKDSIDRHKGQTLEAMVLNAADSLDIGRIGPGYFNLDKFPFLKGKDGETPNEWAQGIRKQLQKEADLLQRMTNPLCANRNAIDRLVQDAMNATSDIQQQMFQDQKTDLLQQISDEFEADWDVPSDAYMKRFEDTVRNNPQLFPLLSKYYH